MSRTTSQAANGPVYTKGNWFWQGEERFLIKGISYIPRTPGGSPWGTESKVDPLDEGRIGELKRDVAVFRELGLNTIQVSTLKSGKDYSKAMNLLADAGIYVLVTLFDDFPAPDHTKDKGPNLDTTAYYTADLLKPALQAVDEMADYPNLLGFVVGVEAINRPEVSKLAEVYRATVRDVKTWLRARGGRRPPVGVSINDRPMIKRDMLEYFTAGDNLERVDFFAMDSWGWVYKSSFQISGWKTMVEAYGKYPVPMYLSAFGAHAGKRRLWEEIGCLFSPDMTGVFSGGCLYTYFEHGNRYGIVKAMGHEVKNKDEYARLRGQFEAVNQKVQDEVFTAQCKDYESWEGACPQTGQRWHPKPGLPQVEQGLETLILELMDEKEWDLVDTNEAVEAGDTNGEAVEQLTEHLSKMSVPKES
jgi:hypothetical protein